MPAPEIEIRGSGNSYGIFYAGQQIGKANGYENACIRARTAESRLQQQPRICMCCNRPFTAAGPYLRLCGHCKETYA